jgi:hypothetical protein
MVHARGFAVSIERSIKSFVRSFLQVIVQEGSAILLGMNPYPLHCPGGEGPLSWGRLLTSLLRREHFAGLLKKKEPNKLIKVPLIRGN